MAEGIHHRHTARAVATLLVAMLAVACGSAGSAANEDAVTTTRGNASTSTTRPRTSDAPTQVALGPGHACALVDGGHVECWGDNNNGQLGAGDIRKAETSVVTVEGISDASQISAGLGHTCVVVTHGRVTCWGKGTGGVVADNTAQVPVSGITGATDISVGSGHSCAVLARGTVKCWGKNQYGQLGDGTTTDSETPVTVVGITGATHVAASQFFTCAVLAGGTVKCWGSNGAGQLGNGKGRLGGGTAADSSIPVDVVGITDATEIGAGFSHVCAVVGGGAVECWGDDQYGQIDQIRTYTLIPTPKQVPGISGATEVFGGEQHSCALLESGRGPCWGNNEYGQRGLGPINGSAPAPGAPVVGITDASRMGSAGTFNCAVVAGDEIRCWGSNSYGLVGDAATTDSPTPVPVRGASSVTSADTTSTTSSPASTGRVGDLSLMNGTYRRVKATSPCAVESTATTAPAPHAWLWAPACAPERKIDDFSFVLEITIKGGAFKVSVGYGPDVTCTGSISDVTSPSPNHAEVTLTAVKCANPAPDVRGELRDPG